MAHAALHIGVDVGGTNTDGVLLDPSSPDSSNHGILAYHKAATTPDPSDGIEACIKQLLKDAKIDVSKVTSLAIGTTHFINAVLEENPARLVPVAVIRLCGPFAREQYPGIDWPPNLASIICAHHGFVDGGLEIDGDLIRELKEDQIKNQCELIRQKGIKSIVVNGIFSPADVVELQEERVGEWIQKHYPEADVVLSKHVANLGFLERENAAILNASILPYARSTIASFERAARSLNLACPVFLTQNDGTLLPARRAARVPIRTFNSGPTNSMSGAAFLVRHELGLSKGRPMLVADIGGTSTDVGVLLPSGLPRQAAAVTDVAGIRMNFSCPDMKSIGLGGGSIVRRNSGEEKLTIGPDSVGLRIQTAALVFGGDTPTATDYAVAASSADLRIGSAARVPAEVRNHTEEYRSVLHGMLEDIIDRMKTNADDIDLLLVGGGAVLVEDGAKLKGTSKVIKPNYSVVANAIGAAIARVSGTVDMVRPTTLKTTQQVLEEVSQLAIDRTVENGARRESVELAEVDVIPVQYVANKARFIVKAIGEFDCSRAPPAAIDNPEFDQAAKVIVQQTHVSRQPKMQPAPRPSASELEGYRPVVDVNRVWTLSERDMDWIATGCYILGAGGGGSPYGELVRVRELLRKGSAIRVVSVDDLEDSARVTGGCGMGSPAVVIEKLFSNQMMDAQRAVWDYLGGKPDAMIGLEIGGLNGLQAFLLGASANMDVPVVDGDFMGRAYPLMWQLTSVVHGGDHAHALPNALADGGGNVILMTAATSERMVERTFRAACAEMGSAVGYAKAAYMGEDVKKWAVKGSVSLSWRIGRAVHVCRARSETEAVAEAIVDAVGGDKTARVLFRGKIVSVERKTVKGHLYGEATIVDASGKRLLITFMNENLAATLLLPTGSSAEREVLATVPDLVVVADAASGEAIGTSDYRYGLHVFVLGIAASEHWTRTEKGIELGGPKAFGMEMEYRRLGVHIEPRSVIDEYAAKA